MADAAPPNVDAPAIMQLLQQIQEAVQAYGGRLASVETLVTARGEASVPPVQVTPPAGVGSSAPRGNSRPKPPKPPVFNPDDTDRVKAAGVRRWLFQVERNLALQESPADPFSDEWKVEYAGTLLAGSALDWWSQLSVAAAVVPDEDQPQETDANPRVTRRLFDTTHPELQEAGGVIMDVKPTTWQGFRDAMIARFYVINPADQARADIHKLRQLSSVADYTKRFMAAVAYLPKVDLGDKKVQYLKGLKSEVYDKMTQQDLDSYTMGDMVRAAGRIDTRNFEDRRNRTEWQPRSQQQRQFQRRPNINAVNADVDGTERGGSLEDEEAEIAAFDTGDAQTRKAVTCYKCGKLGHIRRDCRSGQGGAAKGTGGSGNDKRQ